MALKTGSSPLARGLRVVDQSPVGGVGIIPARAGFTAWRTPPGGSGGDHPRSRGVYNVTTVTADTQEGSSPLARGLRVSRLCFVRMFGIIPARAGFTCSTRPGSGSRADHPRSRGVYLLRTGVPARQRGSSPLARGLRVGAAHPAHATGIIPARAGFTLADPWNPNDEPHYQTAFTFTADLAPAPQSSDSAVVSQRSTRTPSEA